MLRARGFLTRLPNRPCTANLGLSVLEGSEIQFLALIGHTELFLGLLVCRWLHPVLRPHGLVTGLHGTLYWSLLLVEYTSSRCRSLLHADTMQGSLFSADPPGIGVAIHSRVDKPAGCPAAPPPSAAPTLDHCCNSPNTVHSLQLAPKQNPHVAESIGGCSPDCAGQIPAAASLDSQIRVTLDLNPARWDPRHRSLCACCAFLQSQRALAVLAMLRAGSETNCWRWCGSVVVRRLLRLWWANNRPWS